MAEIHSGDTKVPFAIGEVVLAAGMLRKAFPVAQEAVT